MKPRNQLLLSVSVLVLAMAVAVPEAAHASTSCNDTTITSTAGNVTWTSGNCSVSSGGSASQIVANSSSNGTLTNQGQILSTTSVLFNSGTVVSINNAAGGSIISSGSSAIINTGSIGALSNYGSISGSSSGAVMSYGTIGAIYNTGTISGSRIIHNHGLINAITNDTNGVMVATATAIRNDVGTLGTLINHGLIIGVPAIENAVSLGTINNTGTVTSSIGVGILNTGALQQIDNSGTISGSVYAINATGGSIGAITNSGVIAGDINTTTFSALTINGGTSSYGTLTGYAPNSVGTIIATRSNLVFGSGFLLLNDNINVTPTNTVMNNGATLQMTATRSITGNYSQSGGGLVFVVNGASAGALSISGNATINNAAITISGTGLTAGSSFTIVHADGTGTYLNDTGTVVGTNKLTADISSAGNDMIATLSRSSGAYQMLGTSHGQEGADIGRALDQINRSTSPTAIAFQNQVLDAIDALPSSARGSAIKQLAPTQVAPFTQMVMSNTGAVLGAVEQHQQTAMAYDGSTGQAAGSDGSNKTAWAQVLGGGAIRGSNSESDGYRTTDFGLVGGADYHYSDNLMGGAALSWVRSWSNGSDDSNGSTTKMDSYQLTFYGTYRAGQAFFDGQLGAGYNSVNQSRAISVLGSTASASYTGHQYLARGEIGWDQPFGDTTLTPLAGLRWLQSTSGSYTETGAGAANLWVDKRTSNSVTQDLGVKASWSIDTSLGALKPEVRAAWLHDYTQGPIATNGIIGGQTFATSTNRTAADGLQLGAMATLSSTDNLSLRAEYDSELRTKYQSHTGVLKAIVSF